jgi:hypothetical protein
MQKLPVSRTAVLGETCGNSTSGCPPIFLLSPGNIAPLAHDWLHANSLYYWPNSGASTPQPGDIIWSARHQDWVFKIDYRDGKGTGDIVWRMGPSGDFTFRIRTATSGRGTRTSMTLESRTAAPGP